MANKMERFDEFFITMVQETGGVEGLLNLMMSFLYRRTDFYYEADPGDKMGFPPEYAQKMINEIYLTYQKEQWKKKGKKTLAEFEEKMEKYKQLKEDNDKRRAVLEEEPKEVIANANQQSKPQEKVVDNEPTNPEVIKPIDPKFANISTYNGGTNNEENYKWSQNVYDITVQIDLPRKCRGKELEVTMENEYLKAVLKPENTVLIEGKLYDRIKADDSTWNLEDNVKLILTLEKAGENIWKTICKGHQEIDATKVDNSKNLNEFDIETQGALRKIVHEQQRKNNGLPTTEEEQQQEMLKKAWDADGSPFKGQPFDPTKFNIPSNQGGLQQFSGGN